MHRSPDVTVVTQAAFEARAQDPGKSENTENLRAGPAVAVITLGRAEALGLYPSKCI